MPGGCHSNEIESIARTIRIKGRGPDMNTKIIVMLTAILLAVIIMVQNTQVIRMRLLFWSLDISKILLLVILLLLGFVVGYVVATISNKKSSES